MDSVLDLYILAKLDQGLRTPYDLQRVAGLSLGSTVPALRRLSLRKLVMKSEGQTSTKRPRHSYQVTAEGKAKARDGWKEHFKDGKAPVDVDAVLRVVDMAQQYGAKKQKLIAYLRSVAKDRLSLASDLASRAKPGPEPFAYRSTKLVIEVRRLEAESEALKGIAETAERHRRRPDNKIKTYPGQLHLDLPRRGP